MVFKRRTRRGIFRAIGEFFYPRGGWRRATSYVLHRLRRLPDTPHRICLGIACGAFVSFLPLYGLHFTTAALLAWLLRGNILAALLGTFYGNPITFPIMAVTALELGNWIMGAPGGMSFSAVMASIGRASSELSHNLMAVFTIETVHWGRLEAFLWRVFLPFMIGGTIIGIPSAVAIYFAHLPLVHAYQRSRQNRLRQRFEAARNRQRAHENGGDP
ncbi:MAG: hypothetical protein HLUCCA12_02505 [Rhodobacteraceae bacterium HLUCCA12]|nr:MAG: hypothetical protein HLUCCA12_02505 [Rhodobacteraceae bacterium HLUCCA12]